MPIVEINPLTLPILVHDAPVNEKTKKVREMFKMDESGYPEHYKWRGMARLGPTYTMDEPYSKFESYNKDESISEKVTIVGAAILVSFGTHQFFQFRMNKPIWSRLYWPVIASAVFAKCGLWVLNTSLERQARKNHIIVDYVRKHPDRFGPVTRPKVREVLFTYVPNR